jgi:hypothetical protein
MSILTVVKKKDPKLLFRIREVKGKGIEEG